MHTPTSKPASWATIAFLMLLIGCQKSTDLLNPTTQDCQLQSEITVANGSQQATTYAYNEDGLLSKSVSTPASGKPITYTYNYDAAGNVVSALTQGTLATIDFTSTGTYEYTNSRLIKITAQSSSTLVSSDIYKYSYDQTGRIATYSAIFSGPNSGAESYIFTNGILTDGAIVRGGQSSTLTIANGRVASITNPNGSQTRFSYDAKGYNVRSESFDNAGVLQSYVIHQYNATAFKRTSTPYRVVPILEHYGKKDLPPSRDAVYNADGSLKAETIYRYQVNSKGYITSLSYIQNQSGVGGQGTSVTTYTYSNYQ
ncbi:hypothetical protein [Spirosoma pulveris]